MPCPNLKLGDTFYFRRPHNSVFTEVRVVGETRVSWLVRHEGMASWERDQKFPKSGVGYVVGNEDDAALGKWVHRNRWEISQAVERCTEGRILLQIAQLINHELSLNDLPETFKKEAQS
jgi:hypothetical protein